MRPAPRTVTAAALAALAALAAVGVLAPAAHADVPNGRAFSDLAPFGDITCSRDGQVVAHDLIVNPGGGNVAWLPNGTHLVGTSFTMYDANGNPMFTKTYGGESRQQRSDVTCTSTGTDPDSGATVTIVFTAVATP
jgi:hypothetical protein